MSSISWRSLASHVGSLPRWPRRSLIFRSFKPSCSLSHKSPHHHCQPLTSLQCGQPLTSLQCGQLLDLFTRSRSYSKAQQLHAHMISSGILDCNTYLNTKLAAMYASLGFVVETCFIFDRIVLKSSFLWNVIIRCYARGGDPLQAIVLYREMHDFGHKADNFTYPFVLMACGELEMAAIGSRIHGEVIVRGYEADIYVSNSLLSMHSKFGNVEIARKLFDRMPQRDLTSWNTMISGYVKNGKQEMALLLFADLANVGVKLDHASLVSLIPACTDLAALKPGKEIHSYIVRRGMEFNPFLQNALIDMYANSGNIVWARRLFDRMDERDIISWNSMICGYSRQADAIECIDLFCQMNAESVAPDVITILGLIGTCEHLSSLQLGRSLHSYLLRKGLDKEVTVSTSLLDMYAKGGSLRCSCCIFYEMISKSLFSWTAMISGYGLHGRGMDAVACFDEMKASGLRPDKVVFTAVLSACSHTGLVHEGKAIFHEMGNRYSIKPTLEHYSCMVDLLGKAGFLDEAFELIMSMEMEPNADIWAALLTACNIYQNVELAEVVARNAFHLNPKCIDAFVSLCNVYAVEKRWADVERLRCVALANELKKPRGCSFI